MNNNKKEEVIPIKGDLIVSVIYIVDEIKDEYVESIDPINNAFDLNHQELLDSRLNDKYYFPSQLSYPYKFSEKGLNELKEKLKSFDLIESKSIKIGYFENIHNSDQHHFNHDKLKEILIKEKYISFKITGWDNIEFLYFPAFLVIKFDYTNSKIKNYKNYQNFKEYWKEKIDEYNKFTDLRNFLSVSRSKKWSNKPILVFTSMDCISDRFHDRYKPIIDQKNESTINFFNEVSILNHKGDGFRLHRFFNNLYHEYSIFNVWRLYYSVSDVFGDGNSSDRSKISSRNTLIKILKNAIFTHLIIPDGINCLKKYNKTIKKHFEDVRDKRFNFFDSFYGREINEFHKVYKNNNEVYKTIGDSVKRIEEFLEGIKQILSYLENPLEMNGQEIEHITFSDMKKKEIKRKFTEEDYQKQNEEYNEFMHLNTLGVEEGRFRTNDLKILISSYDRIKKLLNQYKKISDSYEKELISSRELLETRRNLLESKKNVLHSIIWPALGALLFASIFFAYLKWWK